MEEYERPRNIWQAGEKPYGTRWKVVVGIKGEKFQKSFNYKEHGGKEKALQKAIEYRDSLYAKHDLTKSGRENSSGIIGVNNSMGYWQAYWMDPNGKQITKRYSISVYGEAEAKRRAIHMRREGVKAAKENRSILFAEPDSLNIKVWRYMDLSKFVAILEHKGLYFPQVDNLNDPFEGAYSRGNVNLRNFAYSKRADLPDIDSLIDKIKEIRKYIVVNCWHMSKHESAGMWKLYAKTNEAICIQSTYKILKACLPGEVNLGMVQYIDYQKDWIPEDDIFYPFLYKRLSFEHEKELRAICDLSRKAQLELELDEEVNRGGVWFPADPEKLIEKIYVAPDSDDWFVDLISKLIKRYNLRKPVIKSPLNAVPLK